MEEEKHLVQKMFQNVPHVGFCFEGRGRRTKFPPLRPISWQFAVVYLGMQMYVARSADPLKSPLGSQPMHPCAFRALFGSAGTLPNH